MSIKKQFKLKLITYEQFSAQINDEIWDLLWWETFDKELKMELAYQLWDNLIISLEGHK